MAYQMHNIYVTVHKIQNIFITQPLAIIIYDSMIEFTETEASQPRLAMLKMESQNFLLNSGSLFIFFSLWILAFILSSILTVSILCL